MSVLDERFASAASELRNHLDGVPVVPPSAVVSRHRRRRYAVGGVAVAAVATTVIAIGAVTTRDKGDISPSASTIAPSPQDIEDSLFVPVGHVGSPEVSVLPSSSQGLYGLVASPGGTALLVSVGSQPVEPDPDAERRDINGRTFYLSGGGDAQFQYGTVDTCVGVDVATAEGGTETWYTDATKLLKSLSIADSDVSIDLPTGWQSFGTGRAGPLLQLTYEYVIGGSSHTVTLAQAVNTPVAALPGIEIGPLVQARYNGQPAWTMEWPGTDYRSLIWNDNGNAVMISSDVPADQLLRHAVVDLFHGETFDWGGALDVVPRGTVAPGSDVPLAGCGPASLTITAPTSQPITDLGSVDRFPAGSVTPIEDPPMFVVNDDTQGLVVFDGESTHLACLLVRRADLSPNDDFSTDPAVEFIDPCHGSAWDRLGNKIGGPAPRDLDRYSVDTTTGRVVVDLANITPGRSSAIYESDTPATSQPRGTSTAPPAPATTSPATP